MKKNNFLGTLKKYREWLWPTIEKELVLMKEYPSYCQLDKKYQKEVDFYLEMVSDYPKRKGKYLRPTLLVLTAEAMGTKKSLTKETAAAMQISEDWILNHDDIEDDSPDRRGAKSLHKIYGTELALNAGDGLHVIMWKMLLKNFKKLPLKTATALSKEFYWMLNRTILGQSIELKWARENRFDLKNEDLFLILESKTGYYTIAGPMRLGAIIAGGNKKQLDTIYRFGVTLGKTFQIIDDVLDLTSNFAGLKKIKGGDIIENKRTIMLMHLIKTSNKADRKIINKILNKKRGEKNENDVKIILKLMEKYGSIDYGKKLAKEIALDALKIFDEEMKFLKKEPYRRQIREGIDFIVNRDY